jgi:putative transposase
MPRPPRIQFEGAFYHVFSRGNRRERIFRDEGDYARFEQLLIEAMNWCGIRLYNWCLMPNHFHLLIQTPDGNLAELMSRLLTRYAKFFNWKHGLVGHVFQGRYGARICDKDAYFKELIRYIQLNPYKGKRGGLVAVGSWKWSSHKYFMGMGAPEGLGKWIDEALRLFGDQQAQARKNYAKLLQDGLAKGDWEDFYKVKNGRFLGDEAFVKKVKKQNREPVRQSERAWVRIHSMEDLILRLAPACGLSEEELRSRRQKRTASRWRKALIYVARRRYRFPVVQIAKYFHRDPTAISQVMSRLKEKMPSEVDVCEGLLQVAKT